MGVLLRQGMCALFLCSGSAYCADAPFPLNRPCKLCDGNQEYVGTYRSGSHSAPLHTYLCETPHCKGSHRLLLDDFTPTQPSEEMASFMEANRCGRCGKLPHECECWEML